MKLSKLQQLVFLGLMVAIGVVISQLFSVTMPTIKFGLGYLTIILASVFFGPLAGAIVGLTQDLLGFFLFVGSNFYFGFTLNAILYGVLSYFLIRLARKINHNVLFWLNNAVAVSLIPLLIWFAFDVDLIRSSAPIQTKYILIACGIVASLALVVFNFLIRKRDQEATYPQTGILFTVMLLYILVSLGLTPLWVYQLYGVPYWGQLPFRLVKMPLEVIAYAAILRPLFASLDGMIRKLDN